MIDISLRNKILLLFLSLIIVSSVTSISAVLLATNNSVEDQAQEKLNIGLKVFDRLMDIRASQLFDSAEVLTSDFGFKAAVQADDQATVLSVLENHGARIDADLMMLASLEGELIASTDQATHRQRAFPFKQLLAQAENEGGLMSIVMFKGNAYQMLMLQVNAPVPVAWAVVGFLIDQSLANQLKDLTSLEVTFNGDEQNKQSFEITTLATTTANQTITNNQLDNQLDNNNNEWLHVIQNNQAYLSLLAPLVDTRQYKVSAILQTSLDEAYAKFSPLKIQILIISSIALALSVIIGFFIARNITQPINNLVTAAQRINSGNYSEEIPFRPSKKNEIEKLASSFNQMQKSIADREQKILYQVYHDTLTGLSNRISAQEQIDECLDVYQHTSKCFALVIINIRHFKQTNDTFGYQVGDELLKAFAHKLDTLSNESRLSARLGADEFLILFKDTPEIDLPSKVEQLLSQLNHNYLIGNLEIPVSVAAGVVTYPTHGGRTDQLLRRADIALNNAKNKKLEVAFYEAGADEKHLKQIRLINDLKTAIAEDQLVMFYQPKVDLHEKRVTQVEALIRWFHSDLGFISPEEFIGLAEQSGLMPALTRWVLRSVLKTAKQWRQDCIELSMAVNLSASDLSHDDLPVYVDNLLTEFDLPTSSIILEITESAVMEDPKQALSVLNRLKTKGIKLAIDDYGTGYSSLSQLKIMPVDELKIDLSFVLKLDESTEDQAIVQSTIDMGHKLGLTIVAEGVENRASWELLEEYGCDKLQGYYISKPQSSVDFIDWFKSYDVINEY